MTDKPESRVIRVGDTVRYRRNEVESAAVVLAIDHCPRRGDKFGRRVVEITWQDRAYGFLRLDAGHCYGSEVL